LSRDQKLTVETPHKADEVLMNSGMALFRESVILYHLNNHLGAAARRAVPMIFTVDAESIPEGWNHRLLVTEIVGPYMLKDLESQGGSVISLREFRLVAARSPCISYSRCLLWTIRPKRNSTQLGCDEICFSSLQ
jgi:hypothetical protein